MQVLDLEGDSGVAVFTHERLERQRRKLTNIAYVPEEA